MASMTRRIFGSSQIGLGETAERILRDRINDNYALKNYILTHNVSADYVFEDGKTFWHLAVEASNVRLIKMLSTEYLQRKNGKRGFDPTFEKFDNHGWTPLSMAARDGKLNAVKALVEAGANPRTTTKAGTSPKTYQSALACAIGAGHPKTADYLLENWDKYDPSKDSLKPIDHAMQLCEAHADYLGKKKGASADTKGQITGALLGVRFDDSKSISTAVQTLRGMQGKALLNPQKGVFTSFLGAYMKMMPDNDQCKVLRQELEHLQGLCSESKSLFGRKPIVYKAPQEQHVPSSACLTKCYNPTFRPGGDRDPK